MAIFLFLTRAAPVSSPATFKFHTFYKQIFLYSKISCTFRRGERSIITPEFLLPTTLHAGYSVKLKNKIPAKHDRWSIFSSNILPYFTSARYARPDGDILSILSRAACIASSNISRACSSSLLETSQAFKRYSQNESPNAPNDVCPANIIINFIFDKRPPP